MDVAGGELSGRVVGVRIEIADGRMVDGQIVEVDLSGAGRALTTNQCKAGESFIFTTNRCRHSESILMRMRSQWALHGARLVAYL